MTSIPRSTLTRLRAVLQAAAMLIGSSLVMAAFLSGLGESISSVV